MEILVLNLDSNLKKVTPPPHILQVGLFAGEIGGHLLSLKELALIGSEPDERSATRVVSPPPPRSLQPKRVGKFEGVVPLGSCQLLIDPLYPAFRDPRGQPPPPWTLNDLHPDRPPRP